MTIYTFYVCTADGISTCFETRELPFDSAAFPVAGVLLKDHSSASFVSVWDDQRPVLCRYRDPPIFRAPGAASRPQSA